MDEKTRSKSNQERGWEVGRPCAGEETQREAAQGDREGGGGGALGDAAGSIVMTPVESSHLAAIGYDDETLTLRVQFQNGDFWDYAEVSRGVLDFLLIHHSPGGFFLTNIRPNYEGTKVHAGTLQDRAEIWLRKPQLEYSGMWVALYGSPARVVGYAETEAEVRAAGGDDCVIVKVPEETK